MSAPKLSSHGKLLIRRYLVWFYKTSKDSLDRIDRKFTQVIVDRKVHARMQQIKLPLSAEERTRLNASIQDFEKYFQTKIADGTKQKFASGKNLTAEYAYLQARHTALEATIAEMLGKSELKKIQKMYEDEMTRRILSREDH